MQQLAHLYQLMGDVDACNEQCVQLLKLDRNNDQATLMLADLQFQRNESETAMYHFQQLLNRNPCKFGRKEIS